MNTNIQRNLRNDVLERVIQYIERSSLKELPKTPQKLLKYAKRRVGY